MQILTLYRFVIPVAFLWRELDWYLRWYQVRLSIDDWRSLQLTSLAICCPFKRKRFCRGRHIVRLCRLPFAFRFNVKLTML